MDVVTNPGGIKVMENQDRTTTSTAIRVSDRASKINFSTELTFNFRARISGGLFHLKYRLNQTSPHSFGLMKIIILRKYLSIAAFGMGTGVVP
jgi:hypothetical protein